MLLSTVQKWNVQFTFLNLVVFLQVQYKQVYITINSKLNIAIITLNIVLLQRKEDELWEIFGRMTELDLYRMDPIGLNLKMGSIPEKKRQMLLKLRATMDDKFGEYAGVEPSLDQMVRRLKAQIGYCYHVMAAGVNHKYENHIL